MADLRPIPTWAYLAGWSMLVGLITLSLISLPVVNTGVPASDKWLHLFSYAWLAFWFYQLYPPHTTTVLAGLILLGLALEGLQFFNPGRSTEWLDAAMNTCGVTASWLAYRLLGWRWFFLRPAKKHHDPG